MQALSAFEAAARLESFTAAARELGTTQPTVSQRIVQLKAELGAPLFDRSRRGVTLTADGRRLYEAVRQSLATLRDATAEIRGRRASGALTILTDAGFATFWLAPRLAGLKRLMHDVNVKLVTSQQGFDPRRDHADVAIAFGNDDWTPCTSTRLFREQVSPVCSPAFRAQHPRVRTRRRSCCAAAAACPADRTGAMVIGGRMVRGARFIRACRRTRNDVHSYALVINMALMGQGVALGWTPLIDALIADGQLVRLIDKPVVTERGYFLVRPPVRPEAPTVPVFRRWLFAESGTAATLPIESAWRFNNATSNSRCH